MEAFTSKLRSSKSLQENGKIMNRDSSKRLAEALPDAGGKKRVLGDITNRTFGNKGKGAKANNAKKELKSKATKSTVISNRNETLPAVKKASPVEDSLKNSFHKISSSSDDSIMYVTAMEIHDSVIDATNIKEEPEEMEMDDPACTLPLGVTDFDITCKDDPNSVYDYVIEIFSYYRERELLFPIKKYLGKQSEMTKSMRAILVDWMVEVQESFELNHETLYLAVKLVDFFLMNHFVEKPKLQLIGATAVFVAAKFDERMPPLVDDFLYICDDSYTRKEFLQTEIKLLKTVNFDLGIPLSYRFLRRFARCSRISMELLTLARFILETALMDYELIDLVDSKIAAGALLLALRMKGLEWNPTLQYYSGYKEHELEDTIVLLNKNICGPPSKHLQTIRTKYSHPIFFEVAKVATLNVSPSGRLLKIT